MSESADLRDLRAPGLRVTGPRLAVLGAVREGGHLTFEEIALLSRRRVGAVSTQAVYNVLRVLTGAGLIRRIEPTDSPMRFEARVGDNHHHLICRAWRQRGGVDCVVGHAPCLEPPSGFGYAIDEAEIIYWGICPGCCPTGDGCEQQSNPREKEVLAHA